MQLYVKRYLQSRGLTEHDFIPSEISGQPADDIHHIFGRRCELLLDTRFMIALTRKEHDNSELKRSLREKFLPLYNKIYLFDNLIQ